MANIFASANAGDINALEMSLISGNVNVDEQNMFGMTALMIACGKGDMNITEYLITNGANINLVDEFGETALMKAASNNESFNTELFKFLINRGADVTRKDVHGRSALDKLPVKYKSEVDDFLKKHNIGNKEEEVDFLNIDNISTIEHNGESADESTEFPGLFAFNSAANEMRSVGREETNLWDFDDINSINENESNPLTAITGGSECKSDSLSRIKAQMRNRMKKKGSSVENTAACHKYPVQLAAEQAVLIGEENDPIIKEIIEFTVSEKNLPVRDKIHNDRHTNQEREIGRASQRPAYKKSDIQQLQKDLSESDQLYLYQGKFVSSTKAFNAKKLDKSTIKKLRSIVHNHGLTRHQIISQVNNIFDGSVTSNSLKRAEVQARAVLNGVKEGKLSEKSATVLLDPLLRVKCNGKTPVEKLKKKMGRKKTRAQNRVFNSVLSKGTSTNVRNTNSVLSKGTSTNVRNTKSVGAAVKNRKKASITTKSNNASRSSTYRTGTCQAILKSGDRSGEKCGRNVPCGYHRNGNNSTSLFDYDDLFERTSYGYSSYGMQSPHGTGTCQAILKSGDRSGEKCGRNVPCGYHHNGNNSTSSTSLFDYDDLFERTSYGYSSYGMQSPHGTGTCQAILKSGPRKGQSCGRDTPCRYHS